MNKNTCKCNIKTELFTVNLLLVLLFLLSTNTSMAYHPDTGHKPLTKLSIKKYNTCYNYKNKPIPVTDDLQLRIIQGNLAMDNGSFSLSDHDTNLPYALLTFHYISRITNWHFYHPDKAQFATQDKFQLSHKRLWNWAKLGLQQASTPHDKALFLGGLVHLIEDLSVPAHVAPVYHGPAAIKYLGDFEHLVNDSENQNQSTLNDIMKIIKDDIDNYDVSLEQIERQLPNDTELCKLIQSTQKLQTPQQIKDQLARDTLSAINQSIPNCPGFTWSIFWPSQQRPSKEEPKTPANDSKVNSAKYFHQYGPQFFSKVSLTNHNAKQSCELKIHDKRYIEFVTKRHVAAIKANMALLNWFYNLE